LAELKAKEVALRLQLANLEAEKKKALATKR
jgi:hypothetical protein